MKMESDCQAAGVIVDEISARPEEEEEYKAIDHYLAIYR
jgi:hypothetical protein